MYVLGLCRMTLGWTPSPGGFASPGSVLMMMMRLILDAFYS
jgi:hypothetical protein